MKDTIIKHLRIVKVATISFFLILMAFNINMAFGFKEKQFEDHCSVTTYCYNLIGKKVGEVSCGTENGSCKRGSDSVTCTDSKGVSHTTSC